MIRASGSFPVKRALILCGLICAASVLHADEFWKSKPPSEWNLKQTMKLLEDSPWSRQEARAVFRPDQVADVVYDKSSRHCDPDALDSGGNCLQAHLKPGTDSSRGQQSDPSTTDEVVFLIRWESAARVENAFARLSELGERATARYLSMPQRLPADRYVVTLKALEKFVVAGTPPGSMPLNLIGSLENDSTGPRARLSAGNLSAAPAESERTGVGAEEAVHFYFPREVNGAPLIPADRLSRVTFEFRGQRFSVKTHFTLSPEMLR